MFWGFMNNCTHFVRGRIGDEAFQSFLSLLSFESVTSLLEDVQCPLNVKDTTFLVFHLVSFLYMVCSLSRVRSEISRRADETPDPEVGPGVENPEWSGEWEDMGQTLKEFSDPIAWDFPCEHIQNLAVVGKYLKEKCQEDSKDKRIIAISWALAYAYCTLLDTVGQQIEAGGQGDKSAATPVTQTAAEPDSESKTLGVAPAKKHAQKPDQPVDDDAGEGPSMPPDNTQSKADKTHTKLGAQPAGTKSNAQPAGTRSGATIESFSLKDFRGLKKDYTQRLDESIISWLFLGIKWEDGRRQILTDVINKITAMSPPTNKKETQAFLGAIGFWRMHIPEYSQIVSPLYLVTRKKKTFQWGPEQQHAFAQIKQEIAHAVALGPVRTGPDVKNVLYSAAGSHGLSWSLWQKVPGETRGRPLGFWSQSYRGSEANYTPTEKKILAAYEGVQAASQVIHDCDICAAIKQAKRVKPLWYGGRWSKYKYGEAWQIDYVTLPQTRQGKRYVLTMVEATTGWLETYPVPHATARNTILGLEKQVLWQHGTPERIESDNGTHFKNSLINTWAREHGIEWVYHIPYHVPATGKVERFNGLLKTTLKALDGGSFKNWEQHLAKAAWLVNTRDSTNRAGPAQSDLLHTVDVDKVPVVHVR
ncbi:hypothetical protein HGM15179_018109, partial [Zosterops borbonicus]